MRFETFKSILLSVDICECELHLRSTNKEGFIGYTTENDKNKYCVVFDKGEFYFDKDSDVLCSLDLECFNSIRYNKGFKEIVNKAKCYLNRN